MNEVSWSMIPSFPDYEASSLGQIRRRLPSARGHRAKILRPWVGIHGYNTVTVVGPEGQVKKLVHRLVCEAFHGQAPSPAHVVAHFDGTRTNNVPDNLRWATRSENAYDAVGHGALPKGDKHWTSRSPERIAKGEKHGRVILSADDVRAIRSASGEIGLGRALAKRFGVSPSTICNIRNRKLWAHVA